MTASRMHVDSEQIGGLDPHFGGRRAEGGDKTGIVGSRFGGGGPALIRGVPRLLADERD